MLSEQCERLDTKLFNPLELFLREYNLPYFGFQKQIEVIGFPNTVFTDCDKMYGFLLETYVKMAISDFQDKHPSLKNFPERDLGQRGKYDFKFDQWGNILVCDPSKIRKPNYQVTEFDGLYTFNDGEDNINIVVEVTSQDTAKRGKLKREVASELNTLPYFLKIILPQYYSDSSPFKNTWREGYHKKLLTPRKVMLDLLTEMFWEQGCQETN
jgi:hypothetical protein